MIRRPQLRRRVLAIAVACSLVAVACSDDGGDADAAATSTTLPPAATLLRVGVEAWPECLNPVTCGSPALRDQVLQHVLPVLLEVDDEGRHVPSPVLAGAPELVVGEGTMTVTYRLAREARWADGQPMTSTDIRATWLAWINTPGAAGADAEGYARIADVDDTDPLVAVVRFATNYGDWRNLFGGERGHVLRADALGGDTDLTGRFADELPFSAGPFQLVSWDGDLAVLAENERYWRERRLAEIDQVRLVRVDDIENRDDLGTFDALVPSTGARPDVPEGFAPFSVPSASVRGVFFDRRSLLLQPLVHRQAIRLAVDRAGLLDRVYDDPPAVVNCLGWLPSVGPWCDDSDLPAVGPDVDLARFVLFTEGWLAGPDGVLARGFQRFEVPLSFDPADPVSTAMAAEITESLDALGIVAVPTQVDTAEWRERSNDGQSTGIGVFRLPVGVSPAVTGLYGCPPVADRMNPLGWCDQRLNDLTQAIEDTVDVDQRLAVVRRLGDLVAEDVAWLPLDRTDDRAFVRDDGVLVPEPVPLSAGPLGRLHDWAFD